MANDDVELVNPLKSYLVVWAVDVDATNPLNAAANAPGIMMDISFKSVYFVQDTDTGECFDVDLSDGDMCPTDVVPQYISNIVKQPGMLHMDDILAKMNVKIYKSPALELGD